MALNQTAIASAVQSFVEFDNQVVKYNDARDAMGKTMATILPLNMAFVDYVETATAWKKAYGGKTDNANDQAWSRAIGQMNGWLAAIKAEQFTIPKATTKEATEKAARRAAHDEKVAAAAKNAKPADLAKRAAMGEKVAVEALAFIGKQKREQEHARLAGITKAIRAQLKDATESQLKDIARLLEIKI